MPFLHEISDFKQLLEVVAKEKQVIPIIAEKDYWLMHCLWGLQQQKLEFELKGGTSLSKGFNIIERFSEDIDIQIHPDDSIDVKTGKNHAKPAHIKGRENFSMQLPMNSILLECNFRVLITLMSQKKCVVQVFEENIAHCFLQ